MQSNSNDPFPEFGGEKPVLLSRAGSMFPVPVSQSSLQRFWRQGVRGNRLKTFLILGRRYTTAKEIRLFVERSLVADDDNNGNAVAYPDYSPTNRDAEIMRKRGRFPSPGQGGVAVE